MHIEIYTIHSHKPSYGIRILDGNDDIFMDREQTYTRKSTANRAAQRLSKKLKVITLQ